MKRKKNQKAEPKNGFTVDYYKIENAISESIEKFHHKTAFPYTKTEGRNMAMKQSPQPALNASKPHAIETRIKTMYSSVYNDTDTKYDLTSNLEEKRSRVSSLFKAYKNRTNRIEEEREQIVQSNEIQKGIQLTKVHTTCQNEELVIDEQIAKKKATELDLESEQATHNSELAETKESYPSKSKNALHIFLLLLIGAFEFVVNNSAFLSVFRDNIIITYCATASVGILLVGLAHISGILLKRNVLPIREKILILSSIIGGALVCLFVGVIRARALENGTQGMSAWQVSGINFAFFLLGLVISYLFGYRNPELIKQYKNVCAQLEVIRKELLALFKQKSQLIEKKSALLNDIELKYNIDVDLMLDGIFANLRSVIISTAKEYNAILSLSKSLYNKINSLYKESIATFRAVNIQYRTDGETPTYFSDPIADLETELSNFEEITVDFNTNINF